MVVTPWQGQRTGRDATRKLLCGGESRQDSRRSDLIDISTSKNVRVCRCRTNPGFNIENRC
jgi:hypothetical protein